MTTDPSTANGFSRVLQGQELSTLRTTFAESNESESTEKPLLWNPSLDEDKNDVVFVSKRYGSEKWIGRAETSFTDLLSGFGSQQNVSRDFSIPPGDQAISKRLPQEHDTKFSMNTWTTMSSGLSLNLMDSGLKTPTQGTDTACQTRGDVRYGAFREFSLISDHRGDNHQANWLMPPPVSPYLQMQTADSRELMPKSGFVHPQDKSKLKEGNCKLFGIPLVSNSATLDAAPLHKSDMNEPSARMQHGIHFHQFPAAESEQSKGSKLVDNQVANCEQEKQIQSVHPTSRDRESKSHSGSIRSCTKVRL